MKTQQTKVGELDPSFNEGKLLDFEFKGFGHCAPGGMDAGRDGVLYVSGARFKELDSPSSQFFILALDANGARYAGFGTNGVLVGTFLKTEEPGVSVRCDAYALHYEYGASPADDRLFLLGQYTYKKNAGSESTYPAVACFLVDGSPDRTFGTDGICVFAGLEGDRASSFFSPEPVAPSVVNGKTRELPTRYGVLRWGVYDRRFYIQGQSADARRVLLIVIDFHGAIDWSFGINGVQAIERGNLFYPSSIFVGADGIYLSGQTQFEIPHAVTKATSAHLDHQGFLDKSYGSHGFLDFMLEPEPSVAGVDVLARLSTGFFIAGGFVTAPASYPQPMLLSHDIRGTLNPGFNGGRPVFIAGGWGSWTRLVEDAHAVTALGNRVLPDNRDRRVIVGRFLSDGRLDRSFADGVGWRQLDELPRYVVAVSLVVRPDRSIVFSGVRSNLETGLDLMVIGALTGQ